MIRHKMLNLFSSIFFLAVFYSHQVNASKLDQFVIKDFQPSDHYRHQICNLQDVNTYVRRYVNTFLRYSKLADQKLLEDVADNAYIHAKVHFRLTAAQLKLLQKVYYEKNSVPSLQDLDHVFSTIMYQSTADELETQVYRLLSHITLMYNILDISFNQWMNVIICVFFLYRLYRDGPGWRLFWLLVFYLHVVEGCKYYLLKLREADVKYYQEMKKLGTLSEECDTRGFGVLGRTWVTFKNFFREDPCVAAYMQSTGHYAESVSFFECMIHPVLARFVTFMEFFGKGINAMVGNMAGNSWWSAPLKAIMAPVVMVVLLAYLSLGVFGLNFSISIPFMSIKTHRNPPQTQPTPSTQRPPPAPLSLEDYSHRDVMAAWERAARLFRAVPEAAFPLRTVVTPPEEAQPDENNPEPSDKKIPSEGTVLNPEEIQLDEKIENLPIEDTPPEPEFEDWVEAEDESEFINLTQETPSPSLVKRLTQF